MLLALSEGATVALITVLVSALIGPVAVAYASARAKRVETAIGQPNGQGNVVQMLQTVIGQQAQLLDGQTGQDARLAVIEGRLGRGDLQLAELGGRLSQQGDQLHDLTERVQRIESSCSRLPAIEAAVHHDDP